jgi:hypothetical protein
LRSSKSIGAFSSGGMTFLYDKPTRSKTDATIFAAARAENGVTKSRILLLAVSRRVG